MQSVKTQTYSYSRLSSFAQCPFKWYMSYVKRMKEPARTYFAVGTICHRVAELSAQLCYKVTCINKLRVYLYKSKVLMNLRNSEAYKDMDVNEFLNTIIEHKKIISSTTFKSFGMLLHNADKAVKTDEYEMVSMPDRATYNRYFSIAVGEERVTDPAIIEESRQIVDRFYDWFDFTVLPNEVMLAEKKLAYDRDWEKVSFFSDKAYFRGVIDNTMYMATSKHVIISDYKTSRSMLTQEQVAEDPQLRSYVKMMIHLMGRENVRTVTIRIVYMRFREIIEHTFDNIDDVVEGAGIWIDTNVKAIESLGDDPEKYLPSRNQYCGRCFLREDNQCPLFVRKEYQGAMSLSVSDETSCKDAWKESEILKDKYESLQKQCKEFINTTDGVVVIDDNAILDKHVSETKKFIPEEVVSLALRNKMKMTDILRYFSITEGNVKKLLKRNNITVEGDSAEALYTTGKRSTFKALTKEEKAKV